MTVGGIALSFKRSPFAVIVVRTACAIILGPDAFSRCVPVVGAQEIDVNSQKQQRTNGIFRVASQTDSSHQLLGSLVILYDVDFSQPAESELEIL